MAPKKQDVHPMLDGVAEQIRPRVSEKGQTLQVENTDCKACFDRKWTMEAIYNIVDNAVKYTPEGGRINIKAMTYELFVRIDITDSGIGIQEDETGKIFGRFYRGRQVQEQEGVGIGLYLAREILTEEGGYIKVQSKKGAGTTFSVFLSV